MKVEKDPARTSYSPASQGEIGHFCQAREEFV